jgi:transformation/transcription domain-associated protein
MLEGPNTPEARNMLIELILSIPARLSDLLVVLTSLMRPLVMALQEGQELVGLGLRTLEYWVDRCDCLQIWPWGTFDRNLCM